MMRSALRLPALACMSALTASSAYSAPSPVPVASPALTNGLYMTRAADCMPCHTSPGGTPFAGGREISTAYGVLTSPNITPDPGTGIGRWTDDQFFASMHDGIGHSGEYLYPVMPFPSYTRMTRADVLDVKRYLLSLKPVFAPRAPSAMRFPFNVRDTLVAWRALYFTPGTFKPDPKHSADWNRGAYLVEGAGHCGACHSPRNMLGGTETAASLSGGTVDQWLAPNISSDRLAGIGDSTTASIVQFLSTGAGASEGVAFGPMAEIVHDSLHYMTSPDLQAIAVYLKAGPDRTGTSPHANPTRADLARGMDLYLANCAQCHQDKGQGIPGVIPRLSGNPVIEKFQPHDMLVAILAGTGDHGHMPGFAGALDDQAVADVANYVRVGFGGQYAPDVTKHLVAGLRASADVGPGGTGKARAFGCPAVGSAAVPKALATPAEVVTLAVGGDTDMANKVDGLITTIRRQQPGISDAALNNMMIASFCPVMANDTALDDGERRDRLMHLSMTVQNALAAAAAPADARVRTSVPLAPGVMQQIERPRPPATPKHRPDPDGGFAGPRLRSPNFPTYPLL